VTWFICRPIKPFSSVAAASAPYGGIIKGSILAVDRALTPQHGQIIVAEVDGELVLKRLLLNPVPALQALSGDNTLSFIDASTELPVWDVVAYALTDIAGLCSLIGGRA